MFDITSSKLLILGLVALIVIGPKDLPALLRTLGRYMGIIKRQAAEFRAQFEEAMRESELDQLKREVETLGSTAEAEMRAAESSVTSELNAAGESVHAAIGGDAKAGAGEAKAEASDRAEPHAEERVADGASELNAAGESVHATIGGDAAGAGEAKAEASDRAEPHAEERVADGDAERAGARPQGAPSPAPAANGADKQSAVGEALRAPEQSGA